MLKQEMYRYEENGKTYIEAWKDSIALLKEQKETPFRCETCEKHTENGICRRWMQEVKDDDYCSFGEMM